MRLENARALVLVHDEQRCGHCLSHRVELAEFETTRYRDHEGEKIVSKVGYFCLDCEQISLPADGALAHLASESTSPTASGHPPLAGPTTW